jgi:hypothetical protein
MSDNNDLVVAGGPGGNLHEMPMVVELGEMFGVPTKSLISLLRTQLIKVPTGKPEATPAELLVVMSVARKYSLDPMMKQLYAWRDNRGDLACMLSMDGWCELARRQPGYKSVSYKYGPDIPTSGKACWEWIEATVHDSERGDIQLPPLYLVEWKKDQGKWLEMPRHKMHVLAFRMAIREVYGISMDVRDPEDFAPAQYTVAASATADRADQLAAQLAEAKAGERIEVLPGETITHIQQAEPALESFWTCPMCQTENDGAECVRCGAPLLPPDEPESAQGHMLIDQPKSRHEGACAAVGCIKAWSLRCAMCGERFCTEHMHENRVKCKVCGGGE